MQEIITNQTPTKKEARFNHTELQLHGFGSVFIHMKFALVGLGFIAPRHIQAICDTGNEIILTCDNETSKKSDFDIFMKMLESEKFKEVDAVSICTPNYLHYWMIKKCLERGKKVLCEKPLCLSEVEAKSLIGKEVFTVLQLRHHPVLSKLKEFVKNKEGTANLQVSVYRNKEYWESWKGASEKSGGILFNLGIHYFDLLQEVFGEAKKINPWTYKDDEATGEVEFQDFKIVYLVNIHEDPEINIRCITIGDEVFKLSDKANLSMEDLHKKVYEDFIQGKGVTPLDASRSIGLVERLCKE